MIFEVEVGAPRVDAKSSPAVVTPNTERIAFEAEVNTPNAAIDIDTPIAVPTSNGPSITFAATPGPRGPQGPPGQGQGDSTAWWYGEGPPSTLVGSKPGDYYIDTLTGTLYRLG